MKRFNNKKKKKGTDKLQNSICTPAFGLRLTLSESFVIQEYDIHVGL